MGDTPAIASPCARVCRINPRTQFCEGCFRRLPEIARWTRLGEGERAAIMADAPRRRAEHEALLRG